MGWDLLIAHPECTYLTVANAGHIANGCSLYTEEEARHRQDVAAEFFMKMIEAPVNKIAVENPVGVMSRRYRKPDQIIQPWQFGEDASKKTCLWLKNLPLLIPSKIIIKERYENQCSNGQNRLGPSSNRSELRATTYRGIAEAMANQWGK